MPAAPTAAKKIAIEAERGNEPPHELDPNIPLPLSKLIMECCETAKENRPSDMREVLRRLEVVKHILERPRPRRTRGGDGNIERTG
jgi:hypothetical protein